MKHSDILKWKESSATSKFDLGLLETKGGIKLKIPHLSNDSTRIVRGESIKCLSHATSNIPKLLTSTQTATLPLNELWKPGSKNPGTIITTSDYRFKIIDSITKIVPKWRLDFVYFLIYGKEHNSQYNDFFIGGKMRVADLLELDSKDALVNSIVCGHYDNVLIMDRGASFNDILCTVREAGGI